MSQTKIPLNGNGRGSRNNRNGSNRNSDPYNRRHDRPGRNSRNRNNRSFLKEKLSGYGIETLVSNMGLILLAIAGIRLAIQSGIGDPAMQAGQVAGFTASTLFIYQLKTKLTAGLYHGSQRRLAEKLFFGGLVFESFTLLAKFFPIIIPAYLATVVFSLPALIYGAYRIRYSDPFLRLEIEKTEKDSLGSMLAQKRIHLTKKMEYIDEIGQLEAKDLTHEIKKDARLKLVKKNKSRIEALAVHQNEDFLSEMEKESGMKWKKKMIGGGRLTRLKVSKLKRPKEVSDAKILKFLPKKKKTRSTHGPTNDPKNPNRRTCKLPKCKNKLTGRQTVACCDSHRAMVADLVSKGQLTKTW